MKHAFLDRYSNIESPIHQLDPRIKIISLLWITVICVTTPPEKYNLFGVCLSIVFILIFLSKIPISFILSRSAIVMPFALLTSIFIIVAADSGFSAMWNVVIKSYIGVLCLILLSSTTPFPMLLNGFHRLKVPKIFILLSSFTYRYLFILLDEVMRIRQACDSRCFKGRWIGEAKVIGNMIGTLFVRSYERGERVYMAMASRGFEGDLKVASYQPQVTSQDILFIAAVILTTSIVRFY
jgi:cobalt/nickel transport system permease protein